MKLLRKLMKISSVFLVCACSKQMAPPQVTDKEQEIRGNEAVNCLNIDLGIPPSDLAERVAAKKKEPEFLLLKRVHLPADATLCQRRDFVDTILYLSKNQDRYIETDPQVQMITSAIQGHEEDFIHLARPNWHSAQSYISDALLVLLSNPSKKSFLRKHLHAYPWLMEVVAKNGWGKDFKSEAISIAEMKKGQVTYDFATVFSQIDDPATEELINKCFVNSGGNRHIFYSRIQSLEWFDPQPSLRKIWMVTSSSLEKQYLVDELVNAGFLPALEYLAHNPKIQIYNDHYKNGLDLFNNVTEQQLTAEEILPWYLENRASIQFDDNLKKFVSMSIKTSSQVRPVNHETIKKSESLSSKFTTGATGELLDGLKYHVIQSGENRKSPSMKKKVKLHYRMSLVGQPSFDSSFKRGSPVTFPVSATIEGYKEVIYHMSEGDHWKVIIPSHLAFGDRGLTTAVPPNTPIEAEILLVEIVE